MWLCCLSIHLSVWLWTKFGLNWDLKESSISKQRRVFTVTINRWGEDLAEFWLWLSSPRTVVVIGSLFAVVIRGFYKEIHFHSIGLNNCYNLRIHKRYWKNYFLLLLRNEIKVGVQRDSSNDNSLCVFGQSIRRVSRNKCAVTIINVHSQCSE